MGRELGEEGAAARENGGFLVRRGGGSGREWIVGCMGGHLVGRRIGGARLEIGGGVWGLGFGDR